MTTMDTPIEPRLHVETWGDGTPVVLVHGSLATGAEEWDAQRPLAEQGFRLLVPDRRGYGRSPAAVGEDFLADADDIAELMGDRRPPRRPLLRRPRRHARRGPPSRGDAVAHAARGADVLARPGPPRRPRTASTRSATSGMRTSPTSEWVVRFLKAVGSDPDEFPPDMLAAAIPLVPVFRRGRPFYEVDLPLAALAAAGFPKLVVSGGHHAGFEASCDALAEHIGASRAVVEGAGHEIQFTGQPINDTLLELWRTPSSAPR